ncbi:medium-chain fatty acid ethyl ester synthase/esterase 1 [Lindgomyces ingoldianus]|uniref:Medium-chain fatty acid ethyl ester synthase/esterase 1 n=1 Tax=Lindgomyces ingoldianus TaxID=673940 RepID=A0ACB6QEQ1_9PLEO|nr:medium-chain fatty acid ethyl ester synthase/esterase 1 [Lindgomyces ingoldianus]KAF2464616.1 medium-chain fatty acid ethyl ester synthase/esterase 1 [Lindgomyces ingoldianus]
MSWLIGHAKTTYTHHNSSITLTTKSGSKTSLSSLSKAVIPPCRLNPLLFNGHLQTVWTAVKDAGPTIYYKRHIFQSTHSVYPGQFGIDIVVRESSPEDPELPERTTYFEDGELEMIRSEDEKPMVICLHGLTGGSHEVYLRQVVAPLQDAGWEACVVNSRGCAGVKITSPQLYNARSTWDIRQAVGWLRETFPNRPLYAVGFSLGANVLTNYVGEEGASCELKAAVVCSNPWNLEVCHHALSRTYLGREVYSRTLCKNLQKLYDMHKEEILKNPKIDREKVRACRYLYEFDRHVQAPTWGYPTEGAYYRDAQSCDAVTAIKIPFLGINAEDDPVSSIEAIPYEEFKQNPYTVLCTTNWGGHLSWFQLGGERWFASAVAEFLKKMQDIDLAAPRESRETNGSVVPANKYPIFDPSHRRLILPL